MRIGLIVGVSGRIGNSLLESLLNNRRYKIVILLSRRENKRIGNIHLKMVNVDFAYMENYSEEFNEVNDVYCLLGTDFTNTQDLEDATMFDYEYPLSIAKVAKKQGVKNFILINPSKASITSNVDKYKIRAKLVAEIKLLGFENLYIFNVNKISKSTNLKSGLFLINKNLGNLVNMIGCNLLHKNKSTPANVLANKMIEVAISNPLDKKEFHTKDY
jgi:hypothetical protein